MKATSCCWSSRRALQSIFLAKVPQATSWCVLGGQRTRQLPQIQTRSVRVMRVASRYPDDAPPRAKYKLGDGRLPRNHEIRSDFIYLKTENEKLGDPVLKDRLLSRMDLSRESLITITTPQLESGQGLQYPLCKIVSKEEEQAEKKKREDRAAEIAAAKRRDMMGKALEINWAIDKHDLGHYLARMKGFLEKGIKVEVTLMRKPRKKLPSREQAQEVVNEIRAAVDEIPGAKVQKIEGDILGTMIYTIRSK